MTVKKAAGGGPSDAGRKPKAPRPSQGFLRAAILPTDESAPPGSQGPTTLPPPPFDTETAVVGLEWWLDAHMALASQLTWLEQRLEPSSESPPSSGTRESHIDTLRSLLADGEAARDALYELYCDAADPRLKVLVTGGGTLETYVRESYAWCNQVVALLGQVAIALRTEGGPDWAAARSDFRQAAATYPARGQACRGAVRGMSIDFANPVEPLRRLPEDLDALLASVTKLHETLSKRFG